MKLIRCYVSSFGKLKDFSYDFSSGMNTFKYDNGWGKSTLATFIKAMFYGITSSKRTVAENERMKYKPWNSTQRFGGYIEFEWGNKVFKIERFFGSKEAEDTVRLFDVETGKEYANTENLGKRIFEIDEDGFLSTTYFTQKDFQIKSNSSLTAKYNAVCQVDDGEDFDKALLSLEEKAKTYKYRGDKGLIPDIKREILQVDEQIEQTQKSVEVVKDLKTQTEKLEARVKKLKQDGALLTDAVSKSANVQAIKVKKQHYDELAEEKNKTLSQLKKVDLVLNGNNVSQSEVDNHILTNNNILSLSTNITTLQHDISTLKNIPQVITKTNTTSKKVLLIFSIILSVFGVLLSSFIDVLLGVSIIVFGLIGLMVYIISTASSKNQQKQERQSYHLLLDEKEKELERLVDSRMQICNKLDSFIAKFNVNKIDRFTALNDISKTILEKNNLSNILSNIDQKLKEYDKDLGAFNRLAKNNENLELLKQKLTLVQNEFSQISNELANKKASLVYHENFASSIVELESKKADLIAKLNGYEEDYQLLNTTAKFLKQADENLKVKYRAPLQQSLNKFLSYVDQNNNAQIDIDLNLTVQENDGNKVPDYYSKGYQNLFDICKRFALIEVLFTGEKPFIILDDPFTNLDDQKVENSLRLIRKLSDEYQILYFVCHDSRRG